jgi:hypothetical protein
MWIILDINTDDSNLYLHAMESTSKVLHYYNGYNTERYICFAPFINIKIPPHNYVVHTIERKDVRRVTMPSNASKYFHVFGLVLLEGL